MSHNFELLTQLEAEYRFGSPAAEALPTDAAVAGNPHFSPSRELLALARSVFLSDSPGTPHEVVFCGVDANSASSNICAGLGRILAINCTRPVCLIDANLSCPRLESILSAARPDLVPEPDLDSCREFLPNLWLAELDCPGAASETGNLSVHRLKDRLAELRKRFEFILIDTPSANSDADATVLGQLTEGAILVIEANSTRKAAALRAKQLLQTMNVRLLGSILNNRTFPIPERLYRKL